MIADHDDGVGKMWKLFGKLMASWLTAFAIAGATVWAGAEDDASEPHAAAADDRAGLPASTPMPGDTAD